MGNIVIVDDSKLARTNLKIILKELGQNILAEGSNGREGYDLYVQHKPQIIFLDMTMPEVDGMTCLKNIMADYPQARVVIVSSVDKDKNKAEALILGCMHYITKPFNKEEIASAVNMILALNE